MDQDEFKGMREGVQADGLLAAINWWNKQNPEYLPTPVKEYKFHETRGWRFDLAWVEEKVAVELQGGNYKNGRHTRAVPLHGEYDKLNAAALGGWAVLLFDTKHLRDPYDCLELVYQLLICRGKQ